MINLSFSLDDLQLRPDQQKAAEEDGALNPDKVFFQYLCSTESGHDPEEEPDDQVRESHAALHGTIWRLDNALAPVPPLGFGCRCAMRYCGADGSAEASVLGATADREIVSVGKAFADYLTGTVPDWKQYADAARKEKSADRLGSVYEALQAGGVAGSLRDIARMIVSAALG